jgi:hypothetical protein
MLAILAGILAVCVTVAVLLVLAGHSVYSRIIPPSANRALGAGFSFFLGLSLFMSSYRLLGLLTSDARLSLALSALLVCIIGLTKTNRTALKNILSKKREYVLSLACIALLYTLIIMFWVQPDEPKGMGVPYYNVGTLHSGRYANIATYIIQTNRIPVLGQNYGQSLLATLPMSIGLNNPFPALSAWLAISLFFLATTLTGIFQFLGLKGAKAYYGVAVVMFGNAALSFSHVQIIDSGSPPLLSGYTDSVASIGSFLLFLYLLNASYRKETASWWGLCAALAALGFSWAITAPQNVVAAVITLCGLLAYSFKTRRKSTHGTVAIGLVLALSVALGALGGGMMTPKGWIDRGVDIPGITEIFPDNPAAGNASGGIYHGKGVEVQPILPCLFQGGESWLSCNDVYAYASHDAENKLIGQLRGPRWYASLEETEYVVETFLWGSLRMVFFPLLGLALLAYHLNSRRGLPALERKSDSTMSGLLAASVAVFLPGFILCLLLMVQDYKWPLTRFMIPGYALSMICLAVCLGRYSRFIKNRWVQAFSVLAVSAIIFAGPLYSVLLRVYLNLSSPDLPSFLLRVGEYALRSGIYP